MESRLLSASTWYTNSLVCVCRGGSGGYYVQLREVPEVVARQIRITCTRDVDGDFRCADGVRTVRNRSRVGELLYREIV